MQYISNAVRQEIDEKKRKKKAKCFKQPQPATNSNEKKIETEIFNDFFFFFFIIFNGKKEIFRRNFIRLLMNPCNTIRLWQLLKLENIDSCCL